MALIIAAAWGALIGGIRAALGGRDLLTSLAGWAFIGAVMAAAVFGGFLAFEGVLYFLAGPPSPQRLLSLTVITVGLLGLVALLP